MTDYTEAIRYAKAILSAGYVRDCDKQLCDLARAVIAMDEELREHEAERWCFNEEHGKWWERLQQLESQLANLTNDVDIGRMENSRLEIQLATARQLIVAYHKREPFAPTVLWDVDKKANQFLKETEGR